MPGSLAIGAPRATETPVVECIAKSPDERTTLFRVRSNETRIYYSLKRYHMCQGLNSDYFHIIGDGHQPNSRGLYTHYKDSLLKVG